MREGKQRFSGNKPKAVTPRPPFTPNIRQHRVEPALVFDLIAHLHRQKAFSKNTFGPGMRTEGVIDHIRKELREIEQCPDDLEEWIDVILLAFDGAWRCGAEPEKIAKALADKQFRNEERSWPDWRDRDVNKAIEHERE